MLKSAACGAWQWDIRPPPFACWRWHQVKPVRRQIKAAGLKLRNGQTPVRPRFGLSLRCKPE